MARIKIDDLSEELEVSRDEMKKVMGGGYLRVSGRTGGLRKGGGDTIIPSTYGLCYGAEFCY